MKNRKENVKINLSTLVFFFSNTLGRPHCVYKNLKTLALRCCADMMENFIGKKENGQIKGLISNDKQYVDDSFLHCTTCHIQPLYQI